MKKRTIFGKITLNAPVTLGFAFACIIVLLLDLITGGSSTNALFCVYRSSLVNPMTYVRCVLHVLGHASWEHLINNMMFILLLGPALEEKYGSFRMFIIIVFTAFVAGFSSILFFPGTVLLGASSVAFSLILLSSFTSTGGDKIPLTFILIAVMYIGSEIYDGIFVADHTSQFAHIIGGAVGTLFGLTLGRRKSK